MGAYLNALREEGSREDLFRELVKQIDRAERAEAALRDGWNERASDLLNEAESAVRQVLIDQAHRSNGQIVYRSYALFQAETFATFAISNLAGKYRAALAAKKDAAP